MGKRFLRIQFVGKRILRIHFVGKRFFRAPNPIQMSGFNFSLKLGFIIKRLKFAFINLLNVLRYKLKMFF